MYDLFTRTISQGLQAFLPIAFCLTWFRRAGAVDPVVGVRCGIVAAIPATALAAYWFQGSSHQAWWEAVLATAALALAIWFARRVFDGAQGRSFGTARPHVYRLAFALAAVLIIVRQTMEIAFASAVALQLGSQDALLAITGGVAASLVVTGLWLIVGGRLPKRALWTATRVFAALFVGQVAMYAFHESAEARLLPWSEVLHAATEPYGPDGIYGRYFSGLLFVIPLAAAVAALIPRSMGADRRWRTVRVLKAVVGVAVLLVAGIALTTAFNGDRTVSFASPVATASKEADVSGRAAIAIARSPHLLFRHTIVDANYSRLSVAPLDAEQPADHAAGERAAADLTCERISYAGDHGICLHADHGLFNTYTAVFFDRTLKATNTIKLDGRPSRTRVSPDGRVAAITVFVAGESYVGSPFSTKTTILDMATGDVLGDLESFTTWRAGARFKNADFNFWGVTFARDSNVFYATLRTAGTTYLVRGDLGLRKLTVVRENVECPALSPDNRLIAFKKRVGSELEPWRFYVLDLATLTDRPIAAETRSIDDQIEWLDDDHILYAVRRFQASSLDIWVAPIDNSAPARVFMPEAESPIVAR